jgi:hypothetical protein
MISPAGNGPFPRNVLFYRRTSEGLPADRQMIFQTGSTIRIFRIIVNYSETGRNSTPGRAMFLKTRVRSSHRKRWNTFGMKAALKSVASPIVPCTLRGAQGSGAGRVKFKKEVRLMKLVGIVLIVLGVLALAYQGIQYTSREKIVDVGLFKITANTKKNIPLPPIVGGAALVAGIVLVVLDRRKAA